MATYFNGNSEIQGDGLQTLILMNPGFVGYSDTTSHHHQSPPPGNFVFLNSTPVNNLSHAPPPSSGQTQPFVGIPLSAAATQHSHPPSLHSQHDISALHGFMPRAVQYSMYNPVDITEARDVTRSQSQQGLSLSLSSQQPGYGSQPPGQTISPTNGGGGGGGDETCPPGGGSSSSASGISNGVNGMQSVLLNSKYLKATQELLDEVVNVGKGVLKSSDALTKSNNGGQVKSPAYATGEGQSGGELTRKRVAELTTAERQEIQMKKAKLVNMLDEVEQRYRQYHNQMQIVISWFEQAAGNGSARTYTALALQTISKQFRCLKDAILGQVKAASKSLGEDDGFGGGRLEGGGGGGGSRLKFVDNQLRQQRALQQLGMIQHNAWRPQRGLPERSVSVLRAWLFEHFLHPYPKDSDKHMLAKQTGLTRSQVSNWFINARVRLWKPMVEEMYLEEVKEHEQNNGSDEKTSKSEANEDSTSKSTAPQEQSLSPENQNRSSFKSKQDKPMNMNINNINPSQMPVSPVSSSINFQNHSRFTLIGSSGMEQIAQFSPKKHRGNEMLHSPSSMQSMNMDTKPEEGNNDQMSMKFGNERQNRDGFSLMGSPTDFIGGLGSYPIGDIGRFSTEQFQTPYPGNGVSLTLGLPHCENLSMQGAHQSFIPNQNIQLGRGVDLGEENEFGAMNNPTNSHSAAMYETMNIQNRKRFAAQLLPDFVA